MAGNIGERFQNETKYDRKRMPKGSLELNKKPGLYKEYPDARTISLIKPEKCGDMSVIGQIGMYV